MTSQLDETPQSPEVVEPHTAPAERSGLIRPQRRLLPRQFTDWQGKYMIGDDPAQPWRDCRIVDVSSAGAGVELVDATDDVSSGCRIILAVHIAGVVRYSEPEKKNGRRVGIQFAQLSAAERTYIESLESLGTGW